MVVSKHCFIYFLFHSDWAGHNISNFFLQTHKIDIIELFIYDPRRGGRETKNK